LFVRPLFSPSPTKIIRRVHGPGNPTRRRGETLVISTGRERQQRVVPWCGAALMRRRNRFVALLVGGSAVLAGCGGSGSGSVPNTITASTSTVQSTATAPPTTIPVFDGGTPTAPIPATASACRLTGLGVSAGSAGGAAGNHGQTILFTNRGGTTCSMGGHPGVAALNAHGDQAAHAIRKPTGMMGGLQGTTNSIAVVDLAPGQTASAEVEGSDVPVGNATSCVYIIPSC
jgi:hypothetical protein